MLLAFTGETGAGPAPPPTVRPWPGPSSAARQACLWASASCPQAAIGWAPPGGWASGQAFLPTPSLRFLGNQSAPAAFRSDTHTCTHTPPPTGTCATRSCLRPHPSPQPRAQTPRGGWECPPCGREMGWPGSRLSQGATGTWTAARFLRVWRAGCSGKGRFWKHPAPWWGRGTLVQSLGLRVGSEAYVGGLLHLSHLFQPPPDRHPPPSLRRKLRSRK